MELMRREALLARYISLKEHIENRKSRPTQQFLLAFCFFIDIVVMPGLAQETSHGSDARFRDAAGEGRFS